MNILQYEAAPPDTVSHIPAPAVLVNGELVQRCAACGELLIDHPGPRTKPLPEEVLARTGKDTAGHRGGVSSYEFTKLHEPLPRDFCLNQRRHTADGTARVLPTARQRRTQSHGRHHN